ncbi:MAG: polysaccharide lyase family 8 super-sandwich domain-containing protein, partial [Gemmiger sp.]
LRMKVKTDNVQGTGFYARMQVGASRNKNLGDGYKVKGTQDWTTYELPLKNLYTLAEANSGPFKLEIFAEYMTGEFWVDQVEIVPDGYPVRIESDKTSLDVGDTVQLKAASPYQGANLAAAVWASSDADVATVDESGVVTARKPGSATITLDVDGNTAEYTILVSDPKAGEYFASMRAKWSDRMTGNDCSDKTDADYLAAMATYEEAGRAAWESMNKKPVGTDSRTTLWADLNMTVSYPGTGKSDSALSVDLNTASTRILAMARAWAAEGSGLYHDAQLQQDITDALTWFHDHVYNENYDSHKKIYGNWWHWWIGIPQDIGSAVILMYDVLSSELIEQEYLTLCNFNGDPTGIYNVWGTVNTMTGANLADTSLVAALRAAVGNDQEGITLATKHIVTLTGSYVTSGDGFYADGSFIQHSNVAFTSGYGATFLKGIEKILYLADGTSWQIAQQDIAIIYEWLLNAYRPLFADGAMMDLAAGRSVARPSHTDLNTGRGVLETAVLLAASAPEDVKEELLVFLKENLIASASCDESFYGKLAPSSMVAAKNIVNDRSIRSTSGDCYAKVFGAMDKFVAHNDTFSLGISYSSARTARFEVGNQENLQGWHQGDGVTYLYNGDQNQYSGGYWATVDPNRLPGITTDHSEWELDADQAWGKYTGNANFNGGSSAGAYAALAMNFKNYSTADNPNLTARKAWFVFDDEVVALGSGITGIDTSRTTETIVENKKINGDNKLVVDGKATAAGVGDSAELADVHWAWLEGNTDADAVGYYFPEGSSVNVLREERTGSWTDVNGASGVSADPITCTYLSLAVPHGDSVNNKIASHKYEYYDYVLLPGKTQDEVAEYAADPDIEVLCNTNFAQVVRDNKANVTGYIFWGDTSVPLRVADVEALKGSATVVRDPETHTLTIGMADVHQNNASLTFRLYGNDLTLVSADEQVSVETDKYGAKLTVNTQGSRGATFTATFHYEDLSDAEQSELAGIRANYADSLTGNSMKDKSDTEYRAVMDKYAADARDALQHLNADAKPGENLFDDVDVQLDWVNKGTNNTDGSANLTTTANRIYAMALAYASEGCTEYYHNAELKAKLQSCFQYVLDGGLCNILNFQNRVFGNWWDWVIGVPKALAPAALLMYDELDEATRQDLYEYLLLLVPSESYCWMRGASKPYLYQATAANAAELAMITALNGLLGNDPAGLYKASDSLTGSLKYVTSGDGFYEDGSYKQHGNFAYTGSYGAEMLRGVTQIASLTNNTSWACTDADTNIIYEWILEAFRPLYADGAVFDMVQGRSVSRYNRSDWSTGRYIMDAILTLSVNAPAEYRDELLSFAKTQTKLGVAYDAAGYYGRLRFSSLIQAKNLLADESIPLDKEVYTKIYGMMDKAVIHGEGYSLGISMFSVRNGATECGNNENFHGWYTADGALSLYVNDLNQYGDNYWATVDLLRLAGITTNHVTQSLANFSIKSNDRAWVGGSASGVANHAAVGMDFKSNYSDLEAKKSWFAFGGSVVALGAGIRTTEGEVTETIVDNRKVDSGNTLLVNGSQVIPAEGDSATLNADWAWLSANTLGSSIGYYFPETTALELLREKRTGKWSDINTNNYPGKPDTEAPENTVTNTFVSMAIDHGAKAENGSYAYVLLPGMTQQQTAAFAAENGIV